MWNRGDEQQRNIHVFMARSFHTHVQLFATTMDPQTPTRPSLPLGVQALLYIELNIQFEVKALFFFAVL